MQKTERRMRFRKSDDWAALAANELFSFSICSNVRAFDFMTEHFPVNLATESEVENEIKS